jgi:hypothetical protein
MLGHYYRGLATTEIAVFEGLLRRILLNLEEGLG